ncbi:MAG: hypothetical protein P8Y20_01685 [Gammaproteobacteria bacterium]
MWFSACQKAIRKKITRENYTGNDAHSDKRLISNLRHWDWTARNLGFKPNMSKLGAEHTKSLLARKVISLPKNAEGVRCKLELNNGTFSKESLKLVVSLLK